MTSNVETPNRVRSVAVVSTGWVQIRPEHAASRGTPLLWWLATSRRWTGRLPINVYVIEHEHGLVLFDSGQDRRSVTDADYFPGGIAGWLFRRLARFGIAPDETVPALLRGSGHDASNVTVCVLSHLHQDHIGGIADLPNARIVVDRREWQTLDAAGPELNGLLVRHLRRPGIDWQPVALETPLDDWFTPFTSGHDLMGDGSLVLLPTPGHTPGSLSLFVRRGTRPPLLLVGDLSYDVSGIERGEIPGVGAPAALARSTGLVAALRARHPDLVVLAAHDPAAERLLAEANGS